VVRIHRLRHWDVGIRRAQGLSHRYVWIVRWGWGLGGHVCLSCFRLLWVHSKDSNCKSVSEFFKKWIITTIETGMTNSATIDLFYTEGHCERDRVPTAAWIHLSINIDVHVPIPNTTKTSPHGQSLTLPSFTLDLCNPSDLVCFALHSSSSHSHGLRFYNLGAIELRVNSIISSSPTSNAIPLGNLS